MKMTVFWILPARHKLKCMALVNTAINIGLVKGGRKYLNRLRDDQPLS
jgi:hypothetical protein